MMTKKNISRVQALFLSAIFLALVLMIYQGLTGQTLPMRFAP